MTKKRHITAVWRNGGFSASYASFVVGSSAVLRLNFCAKNPPLRQAAKRYMKYAFLFTANALHFSIMNKFYFYFFKRGVYGVFFRSAPENDLFIKLCKLTHN